MWLACGGGSGCSRENPWFSVYGVSASGKSSDTFPDSTGPQGPSDETSTGSGTTVPDTTLEPVDETATTTLAETTMTVTSTTDTTADATTDATTDSTTDGPAWMEVLLVDFHDQCPAAVTEWSAGPVNAKLSCAIMPMLPVPPWVGHGAPVPYEVNEETRVLTFALGADPDASITGHYNKLKFVENGAPMRFRSVLVNPGPGTVEVTLFFERPDTTVIGAFHFTPVLEANDPPFVLDEDLSDVPFPPEFVAVLTVTRKSPGNATRLHWLYPRIIQLVP